MGGFFCFVLFFSLISCSSKLGGEKSYSSLSPFSQIWFRPLPPPKIKMLKQGISPPPDKLLYNQLLLGSGNLSSTAFCSHKNSLRGGFVHKSFCGEMVTPTQPPLCISSSFSVKPHLSSASPLPLLRQPSICRVYTLS